MYIWVNHITTQGVEIEWQLTSDKCLLIFCKKTCGWWSSTRVKQEWCFLCDEPPQANQVPCQVENVGEHPESPSCVGLFFKANFLSLLFLILNIIIISITIIRSFLFLSYLLLLLSLLLLLLISLLLLLSLLWSWLLVLLIWHLGDSPFSFARRCRWRVLLPGRKLHAFHFGSWPRRCVAEAGWPSGPSGRRAAGHGRRVVCCILRVDNYIYTHILDIYIYIHNVTICMISALTHTHTHVL